VHEASASARTAMAKVTLADRASSLCKTRGMVGAAAGRRQAGPRGSVVPVR
jgi:hypothetical protein